MFLLRVGLRDFAGMCDSSLPVVHMGVMKQKDHIRHMGSGDISMNFVVLVLSSHTMINNTLYTFSPVM